MQKLAWIKAPIDVLYTGRLGDIRPIMTRTDYTNRVVYLLVQHEDGVEVPCIPFTSESLSGSIVCAA
jgi:hypothetical protein